MKKRVFVCGNSFSEGLYLIKDSVNSPIDYDNVKLGKNKPFIEFIADELDIDYTLLARPIASNYVICKQVEHAIEQKADLVIVTFSTVRHVDFTLKSSRLKTLPKLENLVYEEKTFAPTFKNPTDSNPEDQVVQCLRYPNLEQYAKTTNPEYKIMVDYLNEYNDYLLKIDMERMMVLGVISQLKETNTKFILADLLGSTKGDASTMMNPRSLSDINVMNVINVEPCIRVPLGFSQKYPNPTDDFHFSEEGQREVAKLLLPKVKELLGV